MLLLRRYTLMKNGFNLGVYVTIRNDERLIRPCLTPLMKVFPQVKVIDVGSEDNSLNIIKHLGVPVEEKGVISGREYTDLKNEYGKKHDWVFWVDSDEIYEEGMLKKIKEIRIGDPKHESMRVFWKFVTEDLRSSSYKNAGIKAFNPNVFYFRRAWPREVVSYVGDKESYWRKLGIRQEHDVSKFNGIWCWHGRLLKRSSIKEETPKRKKREALFNSLNKELKWEQLFKFPWEG